MEFKVELVYYQLFSKKVHYEEIENAEHLFNLGEGCTPKQLGVISIKENNRFFLKELEEVVISKGYEYCDYWLRGLLSSYVKRKSLLNGDTPYFLEYYTSWLNNTRLILNGKYLVIQKWCDEYEAFIKNESQSGQNIETMINNGNDKVFIVHGHDNGAKESLARFLENLGLSAIILHEQIDSGKTK